MLNDGNDKLATITSQFMAALNDPSLAYVKRVTIDGEAAYAVHASDGTELAVLADRDTAFAAAASNEFNAVSVH